MSRKTLGIIGGGQLGMMLTEAAKKMPEEISEVIVLDPTAGCPATQAGARQITAGFGDRDAIGELASRSDVITYEIESGDAEALESVQNDAEVNPPPAMLRIIQDKLLQKSFLQKNGMPVGDFAPVRSAAETGDRIERYGAPILLKARRGAYDGRGNYKIGGAGEIGQAFEYFGKRPVFVERFIDFKMEVSVIAARNTRGDIRTYPLAENIHTDNILEMTISPARTGTGIARQAEQIAHDTMKILRGAGVFGIEMFVTQDDCILINEIAPRVHNSGHHTLQSCKTSQFEQHLRAVLGMDLGETALLHNAVMFNILGAKDVTGRYKLVTERENNAYLKMYGKKESRPRRKLGHINMVSDGPMQDLVDRALALKKKTRIERP